MLRDIRDPQEIGHALQSLRRQHPRMKITKLADKVLKNGGIVSNVNVNVLPSSNGSQH